MAVSTNYFETMNHPGQPFEQLRLAVVAMTNVSTITSAISRHGGTASVFEFGESKNAQTAHAASEIANRILTAGIDTVVFVTGVGVQFIVEQAARTVDRQRLLDSLSDVNTIAGSTAAEAELLKLGITPTVVVDRSESWREILMAIDRLAPVVNHTVAVEESGAV